MKDVADVEFFDDELEAQVKAAFDGIEPSAEAQERMLANLLAPDVQTTDKPEAATITMPQAKRRIRPWQVLVPAAAVLALVGVVVALSPQLNFLSFVAPERTAVETASEGATDASAASERAASASLAAETQSAGVNAQASSASAAKETAGATATSEDVAEASSASASAADASAEDEGAEAVVQEDVLDAVSNTGVEQSWARDFYTIELEDGTVLEIDSHTAPVAVDESMAGSLLEETIALNEDADASIACSVYASRTDEEGYLISFLGSNAYFSAHEKADTDQ